MALGADSSRVRRMILKQVGWMTLTGAAVGVTAAYYLDRAPPASYQLEPSDPTVMGVSVVTPALVALWRRLHSRLSSVARAADASASI
jgi:ABC-type antimicrobial peptide transport system permease subunit